MPPRPSTIAGSGLRPARAGDASTASTASSPSCARRCPVARSDAWNGFWALLRYDDVLAAAGDPALFTTTVQNVVPRLAFTGRRPPLHLDPPEHTPYRRALNPYFTPAKMAAIEPALRRIVGDLLDPLVAAGGGDFCAEFTHRLPGYVFAEFFNLTPELGMAIREATREFVDAVQRFEHEDVKRTSLALYDIARTIIDDAPAEPLDPADDPTTGLLAARVDGEPLPEDMLLGTIRQFIVVGMVAPCVFIGSDGRPPGREPGAAGAAARRSRRSSPRRSRSTCGC